tara:strand:+ start:1043 stop:2137 length:1095 start_codon:yes stop_codon:yes gene_type:complete
MFKPLLTLLIFCISFISTAQTLTVKSTLSSRLNETSGIVKENNNSLWTHNDSGDLPIIFNIDSNGTIVDSIFLDSVTHTDFEDITFDDNFNLYVGDFGNNNYNRTNLVIYKILNSDLAKDTVVPQKITFTYSDQTQFPDPNENTDCESLIYKNNKLYLFSKNHGSSGFCKLYELPNTPGNYTAQLIDSVTTPGMVTGADILPNGKLVLLEMGKIHLFDNYTGNDFFGGTHIQFSINFSQKEGVCFKNNDVLYITQEDNNFFPDPKLFELTINYLASIVTIEHNIKTSVFPNPVKEVLNLSFKNIPNDVNKIKVKIFDNSGREFFNNKYEVSDSIKIPLLPLKKGNYLIQIKIKNIKIIKPFIKS